ncbi:unnamed protein product [Boreogadus saida]
MFFGRNAGLGLSNAKELSSFSNKQLGLTDRAVSSPARLAETKANKSAVFKGQGIQRGLRKRLERIPGQSAQHGSTSQEPKQQPSRDIGRVVHRPVGL